MRALAWVAAVAPACGFTGPAVPTDAPGACGGKVWLADFASDPTTVDGNGDGVPDWALRDGSPFPAAQLAGGIWSVPTAGTPLDTQPKQAFTTRTVVHVRMRSTSTSGTRGAVFWINVGYRPTDDTFAPLFVDAKLGAGSQTLSVWTKTPDSKELNVATTTGLPTDFVDVTLDIDPANLTAVVDGTQTVQLVRQLAGPASHDAWATIVAYSGAADFDLIRVEVCP